MEDFNAKVGTDNTDLEHMMGRHGERNENGKLVTLSTGVHKNELVIGETLFPHKNIQKIMWTSPGNRGINQIDHVVLSKK